MMTRREAMKVGVLAGLGLSVLPQAMAQTNSATANLTDSELAAKILADQNLIEVHRKAQDLLKGGLNAGSSYSQVWVRDMNTFIEIALEVNPHERFREALLNFCKLQGPHGDIVDGYVPLNPEK